MAGSGARTRAVAKIAEAADELIAPVEDTEKVVAGQYVDTELFVGIARTFCW